MPGSYAFPRSTRLTRGAEFKLAFDKGRRVVGSHFVCYVLRCEGSESRLGFAVSRKIGPSVSRNRVKRRIREFYRTHRLVLAPGVWLVVVARPGVADLDWPAFSGELERLFRRGNVILGEDGDFLH